MAYREKIAWLAMAAMAIAYGGFFTAMWLAEQWGQASMLAFLALFAAASLVRVAIEGVGRIAIAADAGEPADERDRAIARRGAAAAYYVLMAGMILVGMVMPFGGQGWRISNAALLGLAIAETVRYGIILFSYRRGWHG